MSGKRYTDEFKSEAAIDPARIGLNSMALLAVGGASSPSRMFIGVSCQKIGPEGPPYEGLSNELCN